MLSVRIIPRLELSAADTLGSADELQQAGADEMWFWGFGGAGSGETLGALRRSLCVPITLACAPRLSEIEAGFAAGADRVLLPAHELELIERVTRRHGEGACSAALRTESGAGGAPRYRVGGRSQADDRDPLTWARRAVESGAREVVLSQVDGAGRRRPPSADLTARVSAGLEVPLVTAGLDACDEVYEALAAGACAIQSDTLSKSGESSLGKLKRELALLGVLVRP